MAYELLWITLQRNKDLNIFKTNQSSIFFSTLNKFLNKMMQIKQKHDHYPDDLKIIQNFKVKVTIERKIIQKKQQLKLDFSEREMISNIRPVHVLCYQQQFIHEFKYNFAYSSQFRYSTVFIQILYSCLNGKP